MTVKGWEFLKRFFGWRTWAALGLLLLFAFAGPLDALTRYWNFSTLTKQELIAGVSNYARDRVIPPGYTGPICLYEVDCTGDRARLRLVENIDTWDFEAAKTRIWNRRFSDVCPGRTANFGLHLAGWGESDPLALARWSFFNDRFIPQRSRFQSGAFSEEPWQRCPPEFAVPR